MGFPTASERGLTRLYHYQPFVPEYVRSVLVEHRLHFSDPRSFNDPWDCKPWYRTDNFGDPNELERAIAKYQEVTRKYKPSVTEAEIEQTSSHLRTHPEDLVRISETLSRVMAYGIGELYRIYCLTPHANSELMWAHYARSHSGICFEFDATDPVISVAQAVRYAKDYPLFELVDPEDPSEIVAPLFNKSASWSYEEEYRLVAQENCGRGDGDVIITKNNNMPLPEQSLKSVIVGCLASDATKASIAAFVKQGGRSVDIKHVKRANNRYELMIVA